MSPNRSIPSLREMGLLGFSGAWALFVFIRYGEKIHNPLPLILSAFQTPRPGAPTAALSIWLGSLAAFLASFLIDLALWRLGRRLGSWLGIKPSNILLKIPIEFGLGATAVVELWLALGFMNLWYRLLLAVLLLGLALWALWDTAKDWGKKPPNRMPKIPMPQGFCHRVLACFGVFYLLLSFAHGCAPETWTDSLVYHLGFLADWLARHGMADMPTHSLITFPFAGELYFLNGVILQGTEAAKMLNAWAFLALVLFCGGWAMEWKGPQAAWLAMGLTASFPALLLNAWTTQVENLLAFFTLLWIYVVLRLWTAGKGERLGPWALLAGIFGGMILSIKYTGVIVLAAAFLGFLWQGFVTRQWTGLKPSGVFLGAAAALGILGPWFLRNFCWTGNPVYPYLDSWMGSRHLSDFHREQLIWFSRSFPYDLGPWWKTPWNLTMPPVSIFNFLGPLYLAALPCLFWARSGNPALRFFLRILICAFPVGFYVTQIPRFHIPLFVALGLSLACLGEEIPLGGKGLALAASLSAALCLPFLCGMSSHYFSCGGIWFGFESRQGYLDRMIPAENYQWASWIKDHTARDAGVLLTSDPRGYYMDRPFYSYMIFEPPPLYEWAHRWGDAAGIARRLKEMGVDYLVAPATGPLGDESWLSPGEKPTGKERAILQRFFKSDLKPAFTTKDQVVYQVLG